MFGDPAHGTGIKINGIGAFALAVKGVKMLLIQGLIALLLDFVHGRMPSVMAPGRGGT